MKLEQFIITGMTCASCQANVQKTVSSLNGAESVEVNLLSGLMTLKFNDEILTVEQVINAVKSIGYDAVLKNDSSKKTDLKENWQNSKNEKKKELKSMRIRVILSFVFLILLFYVSMGEMIGLPQFWFFSGAENAMTFALYQLVLTTIIVVINKKFFISGFKALFKRVPNMDSLVAIGSSAAYIYSLVITFILGFRLGHNDIEGVHNLMHSLYYESSATILTLVLFGKFLETVSKLKTTSALDKLINLAPKYAVVIRDDKEERILAEQILLNDIVLIRPGDVVPADGEVVFGEGYLDQSAITGESMPVKRGEGEKVISASLCTNGSFKFRATKVGENTTLAEIIKLVEDAGNTKAPIARIADKVSAVFVPIVIAVSLLSFIVWISITGNIATALTHMIAVLVISCPCALGLATPVAIMVASGKAASLGILIKSAETLETIHKTKIIVFDKTGTITTGKPEVSHVELFAAKSEEVLISELSILEASSNHPIATAIMSKSKKQNKCYKIKNFKNEAGGGISCEVGKELWLAGNLKFIKNHVKNKSDLKRAEESLNAYESQGKTSVLFVKSGEIQGIVCVSDQIREDAKDLISRLNSQKIKTVLLSGDSKLVAEYVASQVGIKEVYSEVLPSDKDKVIQSLQKDGTVVAMVGDGINDSPALTRADVGIAVGSGTDIALDSADVVLTANNLNDISTVLRLSGTTIKNIKLNLFWAFFYNALGIPLAAGIFVPLFGWSLNPMIAAAAMSLSSVCVVLSALSLNLFKFKKTAKNNINTLKIDDKGVKNMKKIIKINGMMCEHCVSHVTEALTKIDGIKNADTSLTEKESVITLSKNVSDEIIKSAIESAGYEVISIESEK